MIKQTKERIFAQQKPKFILQNTFVLSLPPKGKKFFGLQIFFSSGA